MDAGEGEYADVEHAAQPVVSTTLGAASSLAGAFIPAKATEPVEATHAIYDSDMAHDAMNNDGWTALQPEEDEAITMMQDTYDADDGDDASGEQHEIVMDEYAVTDEGAEDDGSMVDAEKEAAQGRDEGVSHEETYQEYGTEHKATPSMHHGESSYESVASTVEPIAADERQAQESAPASLAASNSVNAEPNLSTAQVSPTLAGAGASIEANTKNSLGEEGIVEAQVTETPVAPPVSSEDIQEAREEVISQSNDANENQIAAATGNKEDDGAEELQTNAERHDDEGEDDSQSAVAQAVRLTFNGQDFTLFPDKEPASYLAAVAGPSQSTELEAIPAPQLKAATEVYFRSLDSFFETLRVQECLGDFLDEGTELRLNFVDLDLEVREDDIYAREVTLDDVHRLHEGMGVLGSLHVIVQEGRRFISRYNELATQVAGLLEDAAHSDEEENAGQAQHVAASNDAKIDAKGADAASYEALQKPDAHLAENSVHNVSGEAQEAKAMKSKADDEEGTAIKGDETYVTVREESGEVAPSDQEQEGTQESVEGEAYEDHSKAEEDPHEQYDETQYDEADENGSEQGDATHYEQAQSHDGHEEEEESLVEYDEVYEPNGNEQQHFNGANGGTEEPVDEYVEIKSPGSNKRSLDINYDEKGASLYDEAEDASAEGTAETKRARYEPTAA